MTVGVSTSVNVRQDIYLSLPYCNRSGLTGVPTKPNIPYAGISSTPTLVGILVAFPNSTQTESTTQRLLGGSPVSPLPAMYRVGASVPFLCRLLYPYTHSLVGLWSSGRIHLSMDGGTVHAFASFSWPRYG